MPRVCGSVAPHGLPVQQPRGETAVKILWSWFLICCLKSIGRETEREREREREREKAKRERKRTLGKMTDDEHLVQDEDETE